MSASYSELKILILCLSLAIGAFFPRFSFCLGPIQALHMMDQHKPRDFNVSAMTLSLPGKSCSEASYSRSFFKGGALGSQISGSDKTFSFGSTTSFLFPWCYISPSWSLSVASALLGVSFSFSMLILLEPFSIIIVLFLVCLTVKQLSLHSSNSFYVVYPIFISLTISTLFL